MAEDLKAHERINKLMALYDGYFATLFGRLGVISGSTNSSIAFNQTLAAVRAGDFSNYAGIQVSADVNGASGWFYKTSGPATDDGKNFLKDSIGTVFARVPAT